MNTAICRLREWMSEHKYDGVLLRKRANFAWVTGGRDNHIINTSGLGIADLIIMPDEVVCVTSTIEEHRLRNEELFDFAARFVVCDWTKGIEEATKQILSGTRTAADVHAPFADDISGAISQLRSVLTEKQLVQYREVCQAAVRAVETVGRMIRPGQSEFEIAALLMHEITSLSCMPVVVLVAADERAYKYRHPIPTQNRLEKYAMLVVCAEKYGLVANITRYVHFGKLPEVIIENRNKCAYIYSRMLAETRAGNSIAGVFHAARRAYAEVGRPDDWKYLHLGGLTGYASREYLATPAASEIMQPYQAFAWNPSLPGIKLEDTLLVQEKDIEILTCMHNWPGEKIAHGGCVYSYPDILVR